MAFVYYSQGEYAKALEYYGKALAIEEKVLGKEHPSTAATYKGIADVYRHQKDFIAALGYYENALSVYLKKFGNEHQKTRKVLERIEEVNEVIRSGEV